MKEVVCITCPNSCHMMVELQDGKWITKGNRCPRGQKFAEEEMTCPKRTFSTTVRTAWSEVPVIPVRVSEEECIGRNDVLIPHVLGLDADVIVTSDRLKEYLTEGKNE